MSKTKRKWCPSSEQKHTKEQLQQHGLKEAHVLAVVNKGQNKSTSCFVFWELIEPRALVTLGEILPSITDIHRFSSCLVLALFCFLSKDFFLFQSVSWEQNELVSNLWPQLLCVNKICYRIEMGSLPWKVAGESMNYEDYDTFAVY